MILICVRDRQLYQCKRPIFKNKSNSKYVCSNEIGSMIDSGIITDKSVCREEISELEVNF